MSTYYRPGPWPAIVGANVVALLAAAPDAAVVSALWNVVEAGGALDQLLGVLLQAGIGELPSFAVAATVHDQVHVLVRGEGSADVAGAEVRAAGLATWREESFPSGSAVSLALTRDGGQAPSYPAGLGVVLAAAVELRAAASVVAVPVGVTVDEPAVRAAADTRAFIPSQEPAATDKFAEPDEPTPVTPEDSRTTSRGARYQHMFRPRPDRAETSPPQPAEPGPSDEPERRGATEPTPTPQPEPAPTAASNGLIDGVPWLSASTASTASTAATSAARHSAVETHAPVVPVAVVSDAAEDDSDGDGGATIKRGQHEKLLAELAASADAAGPLVHAVTCERGHLNDPQRERCRVCQQPLAEQPPVTVPRPVLGELRLSTGDVVVLDRGVLLGRNPKTDAERGDRPHLVKVGVGKTDVSRNHVSVVLDGWHVLVQDLRSTNGTEVTLPGRPPQRLRDGEPMPIEPGTLVVLADGVSFRYEVSP